LEFTFKAATEALVLRLKFAILGTISTSSIPTGWPRLNPVHYWFSTSCSSYFTDIFSSWYVFNEHLGVYIKIVPLAIYDLFSEVSLAYAIMGDGYWDNDAKTVLLCTDNFTEREVETLIEIFYSKFGLIATKRRRILPDGKVYWRIRFSSTCNNLTLLRSLVSPNMAPLRRPYSLGI
jgi:hypothetical protein